MSSPVFLSTKSPISVTQASYQWRKNPVLYMLGNNPALSTTGFFFNCTCTGTIRVNSATCMLSANESLLCVTQCGRYTQFPAEATRFKLSSVDPGGWLRMKASEQ